MLHALRSGQRNRAGECLRDAIFRQGASSRRHGLLWSPHVRTPDPLIDERLRGLGARIIYKKVDDPKTLNGIYTQLYEHTFPAELSSYTTLHGEPHMLVSLRRGMNLAYEYLPGGRDPGILSRIPEDADRLEELIRTDEVLKRLIRPREESYEHKYLESLDGISKKLRTLAEGCSRHDSKVLKSISRSLKRAAKREPGKLAANIGPERVHQPDLKYPNIVIDQGTPRYIDLEKVSTLQHPAHVHAHYLLDPQRPGDPKEHLEELLNLHGGLDAVYFYHVRQTHLMLNRTSYVPFTSWVPVKQERNRGRLERLRMVAAAVRREYNSASALADLMPEHVPSRIFDSQSRTLQVQYHRRS